MNRLKYFLVLLLVSTIAFISCATEIPGIDPPKDKLFFPTGLLFDSESKTLFITNGNSDLKYNGSTLMALDMEKISDRVSNPLDNSGCKIDPENQGEFLCDMEEDLVLHSIRLGSYAGDMVKFSAPAGSSAAYRLMISVRSDPSLTFVDVYTDSSGKVTCLDCGEGCDGGYPADCKSSHRISLDEGLASDPFKLLYDEENGYIIVTHLGEGDLTMVDVLMDPPGVSQVLSDVFTSSNGRSGSYEAIKSGSSGSEYFVSNSQSPEIQRFSLQYSPSDAANFLVPSGMYFFQSPYGPMEVGAEIRGMAFSTDYSRLYVAVKTPPMLLTLDMEPNDEGIPSLDVLTVTELPMQPSLVKLVTTFGGADKVLIMSYPEGQMIVVEPEFGDMVQKVAVGSGPHEFIIMNNEYFDGILSVNFGESTISFIREEDGLFSRMGRLGQPVTIGK
jgi:hypothetical protein